MNIPPLTQADLLALLRRTTDQGWLDAMLAQPDGQAVINSWLAIFAAASEAVSGQVDCSMISTAPAGRQGVCTLTLSRSNTLASVTIPKGYTFVTKLGVELTVACDVQIAVGQATVVLPLVTTRQIDLVNTVDPAFDDILSPGDYPDAALGAPDPVVIGSPFGVFTATTGSMTAPRKYHTATLLENGTVLIAGGSSGWGGALISAELYDPTAGTFTATGSMTAERYEHTATLLGNGTVLIAGGWNDASGSILTSAELYDPAAGTFSSTGSMTVARFWHTATLLGNGMVLIAGGWNGTTALASAELYDPTAHTWAASGTMGVARIGHTSVTLPDGSVLVSGARDINFHCLKSQEIYSPTTGIFSATGDMTMARAYHAATVFPASPAHPLGLVLFTGGITNDASFLADAELFDPATGVSTATGNMNLPRFEHVSELLPEGNVLVATGAGIGPLGSTPTAEIYMTASGIFVVTADVLVPGDGRLGTVLGNGGVLLTGGDLSGGAIAEAELFYVLPGVSPFGLPHTGQSLTYVSSTPITGAVEDWLSALGNERGCIRQDGEDGETYRAHVRMIPDAVSPLAIARAVDATATVLPERWLTEPFNDGADPDVKLAMNIGFFDSPFCDADFCDDWLGVQLTNKRPVTTLETPGMRESRAYVRVDLVGQLQDPDGSVLYCDDGYCDDPAWGYPDTEVHPVIQGASQALLQEARNKIAGGVSFDVYVENSTLLQQQSTLDTATTGTGIVVFHLAPDTGKAWYLREGLLTGDVGGLLDPATQGIAVRIELEDGTVLQTLWAAGVVSLRAYELAALGYCGQRVVSIEGWGLSTVSLAPPNSLNMVGSFSVNECTI